jgi:hypothetical protein
MQQATRYAFWLLAAVLLLAALINALKQFVGPELFDPVLPCALAVGGLGFGYLGTLFVVPPDSASCAGDADDGTEDETPDAQT